MIRMKKKVVLGLLAGVLAASLAVPSYAASRKPIDVYKRQDMWGPEESESSSTHPWPCSSMTGYPSSFY